MESHKIKINQLTQKLEQLSTKYVNFSKEIYALRKEITTLKTQVDSTSSPEKVELPKYLSDLATDPPKKEIAPPIQSDQEWVPQTKVQKTPTISLDLEKFIGENLINKIGIIFTIIGVAIGAKYSIDNNLISPLTRIILGYLSGIVLLGFGIKLKEKYEAYSAVLVSGAMAIMYFITFAAYSFYGLMPQLMAFGLMVVLTAFTVFAAIKYNRQVIALIGLVGAYAVPFLLSDGAGNMATLFAYIAIINVGILFIAFKKNWNPVYYTAFGLTWLIYSPWYISEQSNDNIGMAMSFAVIFFGIFYLTFLGHKLIRKEDFNIADVVILLANTFIFFGVGYFALEEHPIGTNLLGLFTLGNAFIHFIVCAVLYKNNIGNKNLFYLISGLVLVFITIAIPIELDGNWVTLLWMTEACLLFWLGRTKGIAPYEYVSYPLMILAAISFYGNWEVAYSYFQYDETVGRILPLLNIQFLTSALFIAGFGFINYLFFNKKYSHPFKKDWEVVKLFSYVLPCTLIAIIYLAFQGEISFYWKQLYEISRLDQVVNGTSRGNRDLLRFKDIWLINYTILFLSGLSYFNIKKLKINGLGNVNLIVNIFAVIIFLTVGLWELDGLRRSYLNRASDEFFNHGWFNIGIRYVSYCFVGLLLWISQLYTKQSFIKSKLAIPFDLILHFVVLVIASNELINLMKVFESDQSYKLGLSILMGVYALLMVSLGIWKGKRHVRIAAIILFGITLLKVVSFDLAHLDTISKTIVFVSLGVLLLIVSFLYNKYTNLIADENQV